MKSNKIFFTTALFERMIIIFLATPVPLSRILLNLKFPNKEKKKEKKEKGGGYSYRTF